MRYIVLLLIFATSCGPAHHLRRAQYHMNRAKHKGADMTRDTLWGDIKFVAPKMEFSTKLEKLVFKDTIIIRDQFKREVKLKIDTVTNTVFVECPPQQVEVKTPVAVETTIKAGKSVWTYLPWFAVAFVVGVIAGFFARLLISR